MFPVRFYDPMGLADLLSGLLILFTVSPVPTGIAEIHAFFLITKGVGTMIRDIPLPSPFFYLGGPADLMSASILLIGQPPILADYKTILSGILIVKGAWTSLVSIAL
jgi:hypothetical protein